MPPDDFGASPPLPEALVTFHTEHFDLGGDLHGLLAVQRVGASAAEVFYAARILEALSGAALSAINLPVTTNVYANLDVLGQLNLLPRPTGYWAHALRRTGNATRHIHRRIGRDDAELAVLFLERWLCWFFWDYPHGPRLDASLDSLSLRRDADPGLRPLMYILETGAFGADALAGQPSFLRSPTLPAVAAEVLIERGDPEAGRRIALEALERFPDDLRLRQLVGLSYSRQRDLLQARAWLEPLLERHRDDEETLGITAGLFKRLADAEPGSDWLAKAHRAYRHGWKLSRGSNAYLGINAASTAVFLGQWDRARELAAGVRALFVHRLSVLGGSPATASETLGYWDSVSLAEALVVQGNLPAARAAYREAFARHADQRGSIGVTRGQLQRLLAALGRSDDVDAFLNG